MANSLNTITVDGVTYDYNEYMASLNAKTNNRNDALGKDAFLQLLVTQMQYQDPLDPQDNSEYLSWHSSQLWSRCRMYLLLWRRLIHSSRILTPLCWLVSLVA